jgi:hypothetical protein
MGRLGMTRTRIGWILVAAAGISAAAAVVLAMTGQAVGLGSRGTGGIAVILMLTFLGVGAAWLAIANSSPVLRARSVRVSLGIFAIGALMESAAAIGGASMATDPLENMTLVVLTLAGAPVALLGVAALAVTVPMARRSRQLGSA